LNSALRTVELGPQFRAEIAATPLKSPRILQSRNKRGELAR
jgi:hypothetical protein